MPVLDKLNIGVVGAAARGGSFKEALDAHPQARIQAVCDVRADLLPEAQARLGAAEAYTDYDTMLAHSELDAVIIGTPMQYHAPQAIAALERNIHVLSEVTAGVSIAECRALAAAAARSRAVYMMAENYTYMRPNVLVRALAQRGLFGDVYYAEGEYIHELKELNEITPWRRRWQTGIDGITYPTHSLGPILQWMAGDRVARVSCAGSGRHYRDARGREYENEDSCVMLAKTMRGGLIKIRVDMLSERPHAMTNYQLQGTRGCYESARCAGERNRIWLADLCADKQQWRDLAELEAEYLPEIWQHPPGEAARAGHGGGDYFEVLDFMRSILDGTPPPIGIHEALDMTLPGLVSQASIAAGGAWLDVPDSRVWPAGDEPKQQLQMLWPESRLSTPPQATLPPGYELRTFCPGDEAGYLALMHRAGFTQFTPEMVAQTAHDVLPDGWFVVTYRPDGEIVASAMALHNPLSPHPSGGEMGWVAGSPDHAGKGLGYAVCAAAVARLIGMGYRRIYLRTDDWRLPALKTYLKLGFVPFLHAADMEGRWATICERLGWPAAPGDWPRP